MGRHRSTICRELRRNSRKEGPYRPFEASQKARGRRSRSRRNHRFIGADWAQVRRLLRRLWSPEQIAARLRMSGELSISHETIYTYIWRDKRQGGSLYKNLRQAAKKRRKRYGRNDSRGRLQGKKPIEARPQAADDRTELGHLEGDTVMGSTDTHCILTLVDRRSGRVWIGKLENRTVDETNRVAIRLINTADFPVRSLTLDNGTEFHGYKEIEAKTGVPIFFATPHHSWERGTNENTNGLIRQYLAKRKSMKHISQRHCNTIARKLNNRPRKRLDYLSPNEFINEAA